MERKTDLEFIWKETAQSSTFPTSLPHPNKYLYRMSFSFSQQCLAVVDATEVLKLNNGHMLMLFQSQDIDSLVIALALAFLSFIASAFVIFCIVIPILLPYPLSKHVSPVHSFLSKAYDWLILFPFHHFQTILGLGLVLKAPG